MATASAEYGDGLGPYAPNLNDVVWILVLGLPLHLLEAAK